MGHHVKDASLRSEQWPFLACMPSMSYLILLNVCTKVFQLQSRVAYREKSETTAVWVHVNSINSLEQLSRIPILDQLQQHATE